MIIAMIVLFFIIVSIVVLFIYFVKMFYFIECSLYFHLSIYILNLIIRHSGKLMFMFCCFFYHSHLTLFIQMYFISLC